MLSSTSSSLEEYEIGAKTTRSLVPTYPVRLYKSGGLWYTGGYCSLELQAFDANGVRVYDYHFNNGGAQTGTTHVGDNDNVPPDTDGCGYFLRGTFASAASSPIAVIWSTCGITVSTGDLSTSEVAFQSNKDGGSYCSNEGEEPPPPYESSSFSSQSSPSSQSSVSSQSSSSSSSVSTGSICQNYTARGFTATAANGCYSKTGAWENKFPVYSNGSYIFKFGGEPYPRWYLQQAFSLAIHYWSSIDASPTNGGSNYTAQIGLGSGGTIECGCQSSSTQSSESTASGVSSVSSNSSLSSSSSDSSISSDSSSSSYDRSIPVISYLSYCKNMSGVTNPAAGASAGMMVQGFFDERQFPEPADLDIRGGLVRTVANGGWLECSDASHLFSMSRGMVKVTLNFQEGITNGIYQAVSGRATSANPDVVIFTVNPGESYISPPGLYAAMTPSGVEFTVWSDGNKVKVVDSVTTVAPETDVTFAFAWDYERKMLVNSQRVSTAIFVDGVATATSSEPIVAGKLDKLFALGPAILWSSSSATEDPVPARFSLGDVPSGKNGMIGVAIRKVAIYREPYGMEQASSPDIAFVPPLFKQSSMDMTLPMTVEATRWVSVSVDKPRFLPASTIPVVLTETGGVPSQQDLGAMEDETYPDTPTGLPPGIEEVRGRP